MYDISNSKVNNRIDISVLILILLLLDEFIAYLERIKDESNEVIEKKLLLLLTIYVVQLAMYFTFIKINLAQSATLVVSMIIFELSIEGINYDRKK